MRCYNARRCGFLVAASLEYDAVEQNDGSNFAFEYGDTAMLHYRSQDISASTFWQARLPFTWRWFAALQTRPPLQRLPHAAPRGALPTRETDHIVDGNLSDLTFRLTSDCGWSGGRMAHSSPSITANSGASKNSGRLRAVATG